MCRLSRCNEVGWLFQRASRSCMLCLRRVLRRRRVIDRFAGSPTHFSAWDKLVLHKWCWPTLSFPTFFFFSFLPKRGFVVANVVLGAAACLPAWRNTLCQSEFCSVKSLALQDSHYILTAILAFFIPHLWSTRPNSTLSPCSVDESRYILRLRSGQCSRSLWALIDFIFRLSVQTRK